MISIIGLRVRFENRPEDDQGIAENIADDGHESRVYIRKDDGSIDWGMLRASIVMDMDAYRKRVDAHNNPPTWPALPNLATAATVTIPSGVR